MPRRRAAPYRRAVAFTSISPAIPAAGLEWNTNTLNTSGTLSLVITTSPHFGAISIFGSGNGLALRGTGGVAKANYYLLASTNLAAPLTNWTRLLTNQFDNIGDFNFTNQKGINSSKNLYRLQIP